MRTNTTETKNTGTKFDLTTDSLIEKCETISSVFLNLSRKTYANNEA